MPWVAGTIFTVPDQGTQAYACSGCFRLRAGASAVCDPLNGQFVKLFSRDGQTGLSDAEFSQPLLISPENDN